MTDHTAVLTSSRRRLLIIVVPLLALSVIMTGLYLIRTALPGTRSYRFEAAGPTSSVLRVDTGRSGIDVSIRPGEPGRTLVTATGSHSGPTPTIDLRPDGSAIRADCPVEDNYDCDVQLEISTSSDTEVVVDNRGGDIEVDDLTGPLDLRTRNGDIRVGAARTVRAQSVNGEIVVEGRTYERIDASSVNGSIVIYVDGSTTINANANRGGVDITASQCQPYAIDVSAGYSEIAIDNDPRAPRTITARSVAGIVSINC